MFQQIIALIIIAFILSRLLFLRTKKRIGANEFVFWLIFWILATLFIIAIRWIDKLVADIGFSGTGIEVLIYVAVVVLFYLNFRLRLKLEKTEKNVTKIVRKIALDEEDKNNSNN